MRYMLAFILIVFATFMSFAINAKEYFNPGDPVGIRFMCRSESAILAVANADTKTLKAAMAMIQVQSKLGECAVLPGPAKAILRSRVYTYVDYDGVKTEVWLIVSKDVPIYVIVAQPAAKKSSA